MIRLCLAFVAALTVSAASHAAERSNAAMIRDCIEAAAHVYRVPPTILVILLRVEGGSLGAVSTNTNGTVDIGPMQVNSIWVDQVAAHWNTSERRAAVALRDNFCANVEAGTWILRRGLDEAGGNFWEGVGYYHSHDPDHKRTYLRSVLEQVLSLQSRQKPALAANTRRGEPG